MVSPRQKGKNIMKAEISIVMAYFNRRNLLLKTLEILEKHPLKEKIELIVVDDASESDHRLEGYLDTSFETLLVRINPEHKTYINPGIPYNIGVNQARAKKIIIQNPECAHAGDLITPTLNLKENTYLSFNCYALGDDTTNVFLKKDLSEMSFEQYCSAAVRAVYALPQRSADTNGGKRGECWFNHSNIRPSAFHFAAALHKKDWDDLGGFSEDFAHGIGYEDTDFVRRVSKKMDIMYSSELVIHLNHGCNPSFLESNASELYDANEKIYIERAKKDI
jgi:GT2 family glycosyltransferase